ncbi:MAG TPA: cupredoxin domain-containing protein [Blastocatellia bacterium]|nr:cupredoxin domain-containing protein [Blastocatellia bacterium]
MTTIVKSMLLASMTVAAMSTAASAAPGASKKPAAPSTAKKAPAAEPTIVEVSSFKFEPKVVTVKVGTTVRWVQKSGWHTVEADDGSFKSTALKVEDAFFEHTFKKAGTFPYHCSFHGDKGGKDMAGTIIVQK